MQRRADQKARILAVDSSILGVHNIIRKDYREPQATGPKNPLPPLHPYLTCYSFSGVNDFKTLLEKNYAFIVYCNFYKPNKLLTVLRELTQGMNQ